MICKHCEADVTVCGNVLNNDKCRFLITVRYHRTRARHSYGSHAVQLCLHDELYTLTAKEWKETLLDFDDCCAYCLEKKPLELEHFIPLGWGAGTVKWNCVPSCHICNIRKGKLHPALVRAISREAIDRVRTYLTKFM